MIKLKDILNEGLAPSEVKDLLKLKFKSAKGYYKWNDTDNWLEAELRFSYKGKADKFKSDFDITYYIDFDKNELFEGGNRRIKIGTFKNEKDLIKQMKRHFTDWKDDTKTKTDGNSSWSY